MATTSYNTRQREAIRDYLMSLKGEHVTVDQVLAHFSSTKAPIGRTTIYRYLDKLTRDGKARRFSVDGLPCACFQFIDEPEGCDDHFHLKCESCGALLHLECDELQYIREHVFEHHAFDINALKTVFYGTCQECLAKDDRQDVVEDRHRPTVSSYQSAEGLLGPDKRKKGDSANG
ncbi:MAG: transcriptional repressor [Coriobacteriaceae bacterium]|nr:transcriptional repressor [Coriobacteriaceae bacterium]